MPLSSQAIEQAHERAEALLHAVDRAQSMAHTLLAQAWQEGWDARANAAEWHPNPRPENPYLIRQ